jgi:hypothetical protein
VADVGDEVAAQTLEPPLGARVLERDQGAVSIQPLEVRDQQAVAPDRGLHALDAAQNSTVAAGGRGADVGGGAAHDLVQGVDQRRMAQHAHQAAAGHHFAQQVARAIVGPLDVAPPIYHQDGERHRLQRAVGVRGFDDRRECRLGRRLGQDFGLAHLVGGGPARGPDRKPRRPGGEADAANSYRAEPERVAADRNPDQGEEGRPDERVITEKCKERFRQRAHFPA